MSVLVDTSIWSAALRRTGRVLSGPAQELRKLIAVHQVEIIGPIRQEILSGIRDVAQFKKLEARLSAFPDIPITTEDYIMAAKFFNLCRGKGIQGSNTDFLICAVAVRNRLAIFTTDKDFMRFAKYIPILLYEKAKFDHGESQIREGKGISYKKGKRRLKKWAKKKKKSSPPSSEASGGKSRTSRKKRSATGTTRKLP